MTKRILKIIPCVFIFLFLAVPATVSAQRSGKFELIIKAPYPMSEELWIGEAFFLDGYRAATIDTSATLNNGVYCFTGKLAYPTAVRIAGKLGDKRFSELVFIEGGRQEIELGVRDSLVMIVKRPDTRIEQEYQQFMAFSEIKDFSKEIPAAVFEGYIKKHPSSYIALFGIIDQTFNYDFQPWVKEVVVYFDTSVLNTAGFRFFESEYLIRKKLPSLQVKDAHDRPVTLEFDRTDGKYTLLEFWFAGCKGCIPVMQQLKEKYKSALMDKVRIVGISTDNRKLVPQSIRFLNKVKVPWENYWDYDAATFGKQTLLYIYPSNLLIDHTGNIIGKNLDLSQIETLLTPPLNPS